MTAKESDKIILLAGIVLFCITCAVFHGVSDNAFLPLWDDQLYVLENNFVTTGFSSLNIRHAFSDYVAGNWHPVAMLSHMLDVQMFGLNHKYHHLVNLLFHCCNTLLVFLFFAKTTSKLPAFYVALIFGVHPLHVESVAWISERKDLLSSFFILAALCIYPDYADCRTRRKRIAIYLTICLLYVLGLLSKSMVVTFPFMLMIIDYWPLDRYRDTGLKTILAEKVPMVILSCLFIIMTFVTHRYYADITNNFKIMLYSYVRAMYSFVMPVNLSYLYSYSVNLSLLNVVLMSFFLVFLLAASIAAQKKYRFFIAGFLIYLLLYFPTSGIIKIGTHVYADRYMYLPMIGLIVIFVFSLTSVFKRFKMVIPVFACGIAAVTFQYEKSWDSCCNLFLNAINSRSLGARDYVLHHYEVGRYYYEKAEYTAALPYLLEVVDRNKTAGIYKDISLLDNNAQLNRTYINAYEMLVEVLLKSQSEKSALTMINRGLYLDPANIYLTSQKHYLVQRTQRVQR